MIFDDFGVNDFDDLGVLFDTFAKNENHQNHHGLMILDDFDDFGFAPIFVRSVATCLKSWAFHPTSVALWGQRDDFQCASRDLRRMCRQAS